MKKNANLKIHPFFKALGLSLLVGITGCKQTEHKNVFMGYDKPDKYHWSVLVRDLDDGKERVLLYPYDTRESNGYFEHLESGDTISVVTYLSDEDYRRSMILETGGGMTNINYNMDTICIRRERARYNKYRQRFGNVK